MAGKRPKLLTVYTRAASPLVATFTLYKCFNSDVANVKLSGTSSTTRMTDFSLFILSLPPNPLSSGCDIYHLTATYSQLRPHETPDGLLDFRRRP